MKPQHVLVNVLVLTKLILCSIMSILCCHFALLYLILSTPKCPAYRDLMYYWIRKTKYNLVTLWLDRHVSYMKPNLQLSTRFSITETLMNVAATSLLITFLRTLLAVGRLSGKTSQWLTAYWSTIGIKIKSQGLVQRKRFDSKKPQLLQEIRFQSRILY